MELFFHLRDQFGVLTESLDYISNTIYFSACIWRHNEQRYIYPGRQPSEPLYDLDQIVKTLCSLREELKLCAH